MGEAKVRKANGTYVGRSGYRGETLYDRLRRDRNSELTDYASGQPLSVVLDGCESQVFEVSNVADLLARLAEANSVPDLDKMYNVFPKFNSTWFEWRWPNHLEKVAVLMRSDRLANDAGWACSAQFFGDTEKGVAQLLAFARFSLTFEGTFTEPAIKVELQETGKWQTEVRMQYAANLQTKVEWQGEIELEEPVSKSLTGGVVTQLTVVFRSLSFANLREHNLRIVENTPTRQLRRSAEKRCEKPPVSYKTLWIRPGRPARKKQGESGQSCDFAEHIVAGYQVRPHEQHALDKPLFGKKWGLGVFPVKAYYVADHKRGDIKNGKIVKQYRVEIPSAQKLDEQGIIPVHNGRAFA